MWIFLKISNYSLELLSISLHKCLVSLRSPPKQEQGREQAVAGAVSREEAAGPFLRWPFFRIISLKNFLTLCLQMKEGKWIFGHYIFMGFLMDSEGTGEQKQRAAVFIYISKTRSEIPVHFATDVSKILWVSQNSDFFSSFFKDSVMRMNDARKDSHASNPALWMILYSEW